jgi:antibiotic biosynthesis monooxygenase (ABM) superfamily enzyme
MKMTMTTPSFFFFRTNSKPESKSSGLPPYSKRVIVAVIVAIPMAFGLNIPLNSMVSFMPVWGVIMINAIVIPAYMTFIIPKTSKLLSSWLSSSTTKINGVN